MCVPSVGVREIHPEVADGAQINVVLTPESRKVRTTPVTSIWVKEIVTGTELASPFTVRQSTLIERHG
jgi:hypothetical protein